MISIKRFLLVLFLGLFFSNSIFSQTDKLRYLSYAFPMDSLKGFNEIKASNAALRGGYFGTEYKVFMYRAKRDFIIKKYGYSPAPTMDNAKGSLPVINAAPCVNEDFEASAASTSTVVGVGSVGTTLAGWTVSQGQNNSSCTMGGCCPTVGGNDVWIRQTPWVTGTNIGTIPNSPLGGTKVIQMNNEIVNSGECVRIQQTFPVAATNALFRLAYMAQMDGSGHACCDQPYLKITMLNCTSVPLACPSLSINAPGASCAATIPTGWSTNTSGVSFTTGWQLYSLDLTPYIGSCVTIQITVSDCTGWGHHGMAFIDAVCDPMTVNVNNVLFPAGTSAVNVSACGATNATVTAPPGLGPYSWTGPAGSGITSYTNPTFTTVTTGNYTLTMNPPGSCAPITRTVSLAFGSSPTAGFTSANVCTTYTLTNTGSAAPSIQTYSFAGAGAPASYTTSSNTSTVSFPGAGTYTIYQTVTATTSCTATFSQVVNVPVGPNPAFTTATYTQCLNGNSFTFNAALASGTHAYSFNPAAGAPAAGNVNNYGPVSFTAPGTYTVSHTVTNTGCTAQTTSVVVINPHPVITASNTGPVCIGGSVTVNATGGGTYSWTGPNAFVSATQNNTLTNVTAAQGGTYNVTVTQNGCSSTASTTLIVSSATASVTNTGPYCAGATIQLNGNAGATYTWTGPGFNSNLQNPTIPAATTAMAGTYSFVVSFGGCVASGTTAVVVNSLPVPSITTNTPCVGQPLNFTGNGGVSYSWSGPNLFNSNSQNPVIASAALANAGNYVLVVTDANGCQNSTNTNVFINPLPNATASGGAACENMNVSLNASGGTSYSWSGPNGFNSNLQNPSIINAQTSSNGQYTVVVTSAAGCVSTAFTSIVVNPTPVPQIVTNSPICMNSILSLMATGGVSYSWTGPNAFTSSSQNATLTANSINYTGSYQVTVTDANGCSASTSANAIINPIPDAQITAINNTGCSPVCASFNLNSTSAIVNANWTLGDGAVANGTSANNCYLTTGIYTVNVTVTDANGCSNTAQTTAEVYPKPIADFNNAPLKPIINVDPEVTFTDASHGATITSWNWYFMNTAQYTSNVQNPTFIYNDPGSYEVALVVKSDKGCIDTIVRQIIVGEDFGIYVPNAFTPNKDGLNDVFQPKGFGIVKYEIQIFDRWGERIFSTKNFEQGWDGRFRGKGLEYEQTCEEGVYTWLINITSVFGKAHELKGHVTLIK